jgi:hypothetical protein
MAVASCPPRREGPRVALGHDDVGRQRTNPDVMHVGHIRLTLEPGADGDHENSNAFRPAHLDTSNLGE